MKGFISFIKKQGVVGLSIGFILGGAVSGLVASFVNDIINPIIGIALRQVGTLSALSLDILDAKVLYGKFLTVAINFVIISLIVYFGVKKLGLDRLDEPKS